MPTPRLWPVPTDIDSPPPHTHHHRLWPLPADIENPVLLVQGALDVIAAPANAARAAERIPGAELVVLPDWGHMVKGPQEFAAIVGDFLSAHALSE